MRLSSFQSSELLRVHGVWLNEAGSSCGKVLGHLRFTRKDEAGAWCSQKCRDGVERQTGTCIQYGASLEGKRKGAVFCSDVCRKRYAVHDRRNIAETHIQNKALTISRIGYGYSRNRQEGRESPAIAL
jgi:hypothetical protein